MILGRKMLGGGARKIPTRYFEGMDDVELQMMSSDLAVTCLLECISKDPSLAGHPENQGRTRVLSDRNGVPYDTGRYSGPRTGLSKAESPSLC